MHFIKQISFVHFRAYIYLNLKLQQGNMFIDQCAEMVIYSKATVQGLHIVLLGNL